MGNYHVGSSIVSVRSGIIDCGYKMHIYNIIMVPVLQSFERDFISTVAGGNFCAGYDLSELSGFDAADVLPKVEQLENGHGPMVI